MTVAPRPLWWLTQSWRFGNPAAHEPGGTGYTLTRIVGVAVTAIAVAVGGVVIIRDVTPDAAPAPTDTRSRYAGPGLWMGSLPVVGYVPTPTPRGIAVDVYYLAPDISAQQSIL